MATFDFGYNPSRRTNDAYNIERKVSVKDMTTLKPTEIMKKHKINEAELERQVRHETWGAPRHEQEAFSNDVYFKGKKEHDIEVKKKSPIRIGISDAKDVPDAKRN